MWAYAQRDGRPRNIGGALPSPADCQTSCKVWLISVERPRCSNEAKTRTPLKFAGCPKPANRSRPLVRRSSPYCEGIWGRYCCLTSFFLIVDTCPSCEDIVRQSCALVRRWPIFASCISSERRLAHFRPAF